MSRSSSMLLRTANSISRRVAQASVSLLVVLPVVLSVGGCGSPCGNPPFHAGNWPPACYRAFNFASPFNISLPDDRVYLESHSQPAISGPVTQARIGNFNADMAGGGGEGVYYSQPTDPEFTLNCVNDPYGRPDHGCPIDTMQLGGAQLRIPAGARPEGNLAIIVGQPNDYDSHLIIVDQAAGWEYDLWQVQSTSSFQTLGSDSRTVIAGLSPSGGKVDFSWGGRIRLGGTGSSVDRPTGDPVDDANAAHWAETAGRVRVEELMAGTINHALFLNLPCTADVSSVYPADPEARATSCTSTLTSNLGAHPLGTRIWLDMTLQEIDNLPIPAWKKIFLKAWSQYGGFVGDTFGVDSYWLLYIETEGGNMYSSLTDSAGQPYPDLWYQFGAQDDQWPICTAPDCTLGERVGKLYQDPPTDTYDYASNIWPRLRILDPCVTPVPGQSRC